MNKKNRSFRSSIHGLNHSRRGKNTSEPDYLYPASSIFLSNSASVIPLCSDATCLLFIEKLTHPVKKSCLLILLLDIKSTIRKKAHIGNHSQYEHFLFRHSQAFSGLLLGLLYQKLIYLLHQISIRVTFFFSHLPA